MGVCVGANELIEIIDVINVRISCTRNINIAKSVHIEKESVETILIVEVIAGDSPLVIQASNRCRGHSPPTLRNINKAKAPTDIQKAVNY